MQKSHGMLDVNRPPVSSSKEKKNSDSLGDKTLGTEYNKGNSSPKYEFMKLSSPTSNSVKSRFDNGAATDLSTFFE